MVQVPAATGVIEPVGITVQIAGVVLVKVMSLPECVPTLLADKTALPPPTVNAGAAPNWITCGSDLLTLAPAGPLRASRTTRFALIL